MIQSIQETMNLETGQVFLKGKTGENVGPVGRSEAIMAECIVLLHKAD